MLAGPMAAQLSAPRHLGAAVLAITLLWRPAGVHASGAIPSDQTGDILHGATIAAIVGDVDGDEIRELARLTSRTGDADHLAVEVITATADGTPQSHGQVPLERSTGAQQQDLVPARSDEPARLLAWRRDGREQVLATAIGRSAAMPACCLTIWQVELTVGATTLRRLSGVDGGATEIRAVDLDADGTDELVVVRAPEAVSVLRWAGGGFETLGSSLTPAGSGPLISLGDSDGRPGDEVGSIAPSGMRPPGGVLLHRIALDSAGRLRTERADLPFDGTLAAVMSPGGGRLVLGSDFDGAVLLRWPAGVRNVEVEARSLRRRGVPLAALGSGADARILLLRDGGTLDVLGADLRPSLLGVGSGVAAGFFERTAAAPYVGPLPGGLPNGEAALIFRGRMVTQVPAGSQRPRVAERTIASLPGVTPVGVFGPAGARMAVAVPTSLRRAARFDATREGGQLVEPAGRASGITLVTVRTEIVLSAEMDNGVLELATQGAVATERPVTRRSLLVGAAFQARLDAPAGSRVLLRVGGASSEALVDASGSIVLTVGQPASDLGDGTYSASVAVVTPSGHGYEAQWQVRQVTRPPRLTVSAESAPLSFDVPIAGQTDPGASVIVDGQEVLVSADGSFASPVQVGPLPRDVTIEAIDAVGNRASQTISVIGFVDYRQLPWIPIVVALTLLAALVLYLRVPGPIPSRVPVAGDDATLEEID
jgi:hypothetical protein